MPRTRATGHAELAERHARQLISADGTSTDELVAQALVERGLTVATGDVPQPADARRPDDPAAGLVGRVAGGVVAYSNAAKSALLGWLPI